MSLAPATPHKTLNAIVGAALERADSAGIITRCLRVEGTGAASVLRVTTETGSHRLELGAFERLLVIGIGKAAARMGRSLEAVLGDRISAGVVVTKYGHGEPLSRLELYEAGHPVPDEAGVRAARRMEELLADTDERTLVVSLVSGGGSALLVDPYHDGSHELTLADLQEVTRLLLSCGATIQEMNCLRKHLSSVKGGRLARMMMPATSLNLILSDVVGDDPASIASGITAPDPSTYGQALEIATRYGILESLPAAARALVEAGAGSASTTPPETPGPGDPVFERVHNVVIGSNTQALLAAAEAARGAGYTTIVLTSRLVGEAREVAKIFPAMARDVREKGMLAAPPVCVLAGGETTVTLRNADGRGGRNQELLLSALREMVVAESSAAPGDGGATPTAASRIIFASVATDGNDGPTDAAGAYLDETVVRSAAGDTAALERALAENNAHPYLEELGALIRTGPTNTNVCDIQVLLVDA
ncbi:MAG: glycerate kinase type-2 family protein [Spirochaetota bacterium]